MAQSSTSGLVRQTMVHGLSLGGYLDELTEIRGQSEADLCGAAERSLKTLDRFLSSIAIALGMPHNRPSMGDSIRYLEHMGVLSEELA